MFVAYCFKRSQSPCNSLCSYKSIARPSHEECSVLGVGIMFAGRLNVLLIAQILAAVVLEVAGILSQNKCANTQFRSAPEHPCMSCPINNYMYNASATSFATACRCERGWHKVAGTNMGCVQCPQGKAGFSADICTDCPSGFYSAFIGQTRCLECEPGLLCSVTGPTVYASLSKRDDCLGNTTRALLLFESMDVHKIYSNSNENIP